MKRFVAILLAVTMIFALAACGRNNDAGNETKASVAPNEVTVATNPNSVTEDGKTKIRVAWPNELTSLSPFQAASPAFMAFSNEVLEPLCQFDYNYKLHNVICKEWKQIDEEGYKFSIEIYDYVHDSAGNHITADDVIFSIDAKLNSGTQSFGFDKLESYTKTGDYTMEFVINDNGYGVIQQILTGTTVLSKKAFEESGDQMATSVIGTGPYKVTNFVNGSSLTTEAVEDYWQTDESLRGPYAVQNVDIIEKQFITENSQREVALETGTVDFAYNMSGSSVSLLSGNKNITYNAEPGHHVYTLIPSSAGPLADVRLRKAVYYAIDATAIVEAAFDGFAFESTFGLNYTDDFVDAWTEKDYYSYNPDKARELIAEAGAEGTTLRMLVVGSGEVMQQMVQAYLNDVGFNCEFVSLELATYLVDAYNPEAYDLVTITYTSPSTIQLYRVCMDKANYTVGTMNGFVDDKLQEMLALAGSNEGHTDENMTALFEYAAFDQAYFYTPLQTCEISMWRADSGIEEVRYDSGLGPNFGSFTYIWNK